MTIEEYKEEIRNDIKSYIEDNDINVADLYNYYNEDKNDVVSNLNEKMFVSFVTGNDNGSYYCDAYKAKESVSDVLYTDEFKSMCREYGYEMKDPESDDVSIRCYLLNDCIIDVVDEIIEEYKESLVEYTFEENDGCVTTIIAESLGKALEEFEQCNDISYIAKITVNGVTIK